MPLSDTKIRTLKPREKKYIESDEKGLTIEVIPAGAKR
ncbi:Arm DNA-binding domain-containing protein [Microbulbifer spongiae]|uniref:Arm DNA-binding domain-containing protein n=1 Tax=Microbulbifer spongiae TaxID=2944933 RepID=A0ABY9E7A4_9GAMM|nr:Arm DNA-binding domain-containing protein [Microbulbifer sp. MI-G]